MKLQVFPLRRLVDTMRIVLSIVFYAQDARKDQMGYAVGAAAWSKWMRVFYREYDGSAGSYVLDSES